jgi:preprotein translocase subunit YajC
MNPQAIVLIAAVIGFYYFFLIRPRQQEDKRHKQMLASLEPGVEIMTFGGIYATVVSIDDDRVRVSVADGSQLEIAKRAVGTLVPTPETGEVADDESDVDSADDPDDALVSASSEGDAE